MSNIIQNISLIDCITIVGSLLAFVFSIFTYVKTYIYEKRTVTIDAYIALQDSLQFLYQYSKDEIEDFVDDKTSEEYKVISVCIARIELFAVGVKRNVYDLAHGYIDLTLRSRIEYIIDLKLENAKENYYSNTCWLLRKMDKKTK